MESKKKQVKFWLSVYFLTVLKPSDMFYGINMLHFIRQKTSFNSIYEDTILRYMRELKEYGFISYECVCKKESKYKLNNVYPLKSA